MYENHRLFERLGAIVVIIPLASSCSLREKKIQARANGILAGIAGARGHFAAEAEDICDEMDHAKTAVVPSLDKVCSRGCRCASDSSADEDPRTTYDCSQWSAREWQLLKFTGMYSLDGKVSPTVYVHHQATWRRTEQGCRLDFTVYGDLDEDGVYSTYTAWKEATPNGAEGELPDVSILWE